MLALIYSETMDCIFSSETESQSVQDVCMEMSWVKITGRLSFESMKSVTQV